MAQEQLVLRGTKRSHTDCVTATSAGHSGYMNTAAVSPDGSLCASSGKDSVILLWDVYEGKWLFSLDAGSIIHALCFSPTRYWLCAATESSTIKIWDLESKRVVAEINVDFKSEVDNANPNKVMYCTCLSLSWNADGSTLFSCYTDGVVRVWDIGLVESSQPIEDI
ncbi:hypothetical protein CASFOL_017274 [Castilleja foliolosa]|uniref:Guanine nucleotide-binding protein subunit beta-like protein n=1 Tax=Castilleja foliolosa TaxID=1961234 RepID=A0ABD3DCG8_9LAMI